MADVLNFVVSATGRVVGEDGLADDGDAGDCTTGLVAAGLLIFGSMLVSNPIAVGVGDLTPRLMGGGVAPSESSDSSEAAVLGENGVVSGSLRTFAAVPGLELTCSGAGVADD